MIGLVKKWGGVARRRVGIMALTAVVLVTTAPSAFATPTYITDIGVDPDDVITGLSSVLTPFLIAAITLGFGFFAVRLGVRWIKGMARG